MMLKLFADISIRSKIALFMASSIMLGFLIVKSLLLFGFCNYSTLTNWYEWFSVIFFMPPFFTLFLEILYLKAHIKREFNQKNHELMELDKFINEAALISKTDSKGRIVFVNKRFEEVSKWKKREILGKDHRVLNSGTHPSKFWMDMYKTTVKQKKIWNSIVTNVAKDGSLYYVDSYIKAEFDPKGENIVGFTSIRYDVTQVVDSMNEINKKNTYLEHAAKILRHDMHSGINTYIPRGLSSLKRRLTEERIEELKISAPLRMIEEGLKHTQRVYVGVKEFTNLVKKDTQLDMELINPSKALKDYLSSTSYSKQVRIDEISEIEANEALFCTAVDNLIRNGLKYNDSESKKVLIYQEEDCIVVQDNGRGITQEDFEKLSQPYTRKKNQKESGSGLGLNICVAILQEHGFSIWVDEQPVGTKLKIKVK